MPWPTPDLLPSPPFVLLAALLAGGGVWIGIDQGLRSVADTRADASRWFIGATMGTGSALWASMVTLAGGLPAATSRTVGIDALLAGWLCALAAAAAALASVRGDAPRWRRLGLGPLALAVGAAASGVVIVEGLTPWQGAAWHAGGLALAGVVALLASASAAWRLFREPTPTLAGAVTAAGVLGPGLAVAQMLLLAAHDLSAPDAMPASPVAGTLPLQAPVLLGVSSFSVQ